MYMVVIIVLVLKWKYHHKSQKHKSPLVHSTNFWWRRCVSFNWNGSVILAKCLSLTTPEVVILTMTKISSKWKHFHFSVGIHPALKLKCLYFVDFFLCKFRNEWLDEKLGCGYKPLQSTSLLWHHLSSVTFQITGNATGCSTANNVGNKRFTLLALCVMGNPLATDEFPLKKGP